MNLFSMIALQFIAFGCLAAFFICFTVAWRYAKPTPFSIRRNQQLISPPTDPHRVIWLIVWSVLAVLCFLAFLFTVRLTF